MKLVRVNNLIDDDEWSFSACKRVQLDGRTASVLVVVRRLLFLSGGWGSVTQRVRVRVMRV